MPVCVPVCGNCYFILFDCVPLMAMKKSESKVTNYIP